MELDTLRIYEDHRLGHELCKEYLIRPVKEDPSAWPLFVGVTLGVLSGLVVGHNLK